MNSIDDILKMAQNVQAQMAEAQASLDTIEVEGASGGGLVKIRASAKVKEAYEAFLGLLRQGLEAPSTVS